MAQGESGPSGGGGGAAGEDSGLAARLVRVEEHCGFTEYTVEQLSAEMAALNKRVLEVLRRVEGIERRLGELAKPGGGAEGAAGESDVGDAGGGES